MNKLDDLNIKRNIMKTTVTLIITLLVATLHAADLRLGSPFSDHMVLQREKPVAVWGWADPSESVTVAFDGQTKTATAGADGKWSLKLDALKASAESRTLIATGKEGRKVEVKDVLVGEVWFGCGQSNMQTPVTGHSAGDRHLAANAEQSYPLLRLLMANDSWQEATPDTIKEFSALLFSFGLPLNKQLRVPVGLMFRAKDGSPSGPWLSEQMYRADAACVAVAKKFAETYDYPKGKAAYDQAKILYDEEFAKWKPLADAAKREGKQPLRPPTAPTSVVPAGECFGPRPIGSLFEAFIRPYVGYTIRGVLWDQGEGGTRITGVDQFTLMGALIQGWRKEWGQGDFPFLYIQKPSGGGPAWDDTNPVNENANKFSELPKTVPSAIEAEYNYAIHLKIMKYPNTIMVTSTDLAGGIHPVNKSGYGARGAMVAMNAVYGGKGEYYGPIYASHEIKNGKIVIKFKHTGQGLTFKSGDPSTGSRQAGLQGFAIAGEDHQFVWADAVIEGDNVFVSSRTVAKPTAVRYAWASSFPWANLFNKDGLPAQPFRTDDWPVVTAGKK
jgi:sialate O-acetylesterase